MLTETTQNGSSRPAHRSRLHEGAAVAVRAVLALDSSQAPGGDALVGELDGEVVAVITIRDGVVVADPFRTTAPVTKLLRRRRDAVLGTV